MDNPIFLIEYGGATTIKKGEISITDFPPGAKITEYIPLARYNNLQYQFKCLDEAHRQLILRNEKLENDIYRKDKSLTASAEDIERYKNIIDFILETR